MRHLKRGRKLGRNASHRTSLKRNLLLGLFAHERITITYLGRREEPFTAADIVANRFTIALRALQVAPEAPDPLIAWTKDRAVALAPAEAIA